MLLEHKDIKWEDLPYGFRNMPHMIVDVHAINILTTDIADSPDDAHLTSNMLPPTNLIQLP